jgi:hypothetical protein
VHHHNDWYAHVRLLARYAGVQSAGGRPRLWGYLQHGWNIYNGFGARTPLLAGVPKLVWSEAPRRRGWMLGERDFHVLGSPWAYLLRMEPTLGAVPEREREGTIFYPFHGFEKQTIFGDHKRLAREIRAHEPGPVTICLYWLDHRIREIREAYQDAGFRVVTHGYRGDRFTPGDINFLRRQLTELRRHRRVASNRLSTALFYGASVGCEMGVYGEEMLIEDEHPAYGGNQRIRRLWPDLHDPAVPPDVSAEHARIELGLDHVAEPAEVAEVCGWAGGPARRALIYPRDTAFIRPVDPRPVTPGPTGLPETAHAA